MQAISLGQRHRVWASALSREAAPAPPRTGGGFDRLAALRTELGLHRAEFSTVWSEGALAGSHSLEVRMDHPDDGRIEIAYEMMRLPDTRQIVIMGHPSRKRVGAATPSIGHPDGTPVELSPVIGRNE